MLCQVLFSLARCHLVSERHLFASGPLSGLPNTGDPEGIFDQNGGILKAPNSGLPSWDDRIELGLNWQEVKTPRSTPQAPQLRDVDVEDRTGKKEDASHRPEGGGMGQEGHDRHKHEEGDGLSRPD